MNHSIFVVSTGHCCFDVDLSIFGPKNISIALNAFFVWVNRTAQEKKDNRCANNEHGEKKQGEQKMYVQYTKLSRAAHMVNICIWSNESVKWKVSKNWKKG